MTESELLQRIDRGIADADAGNFMDSEEFERELEEEFGLA
jgi:predicted transcriptional regulator